MSFVYFRVVCRGYALRCVSTNTNYQCLYLNYLSKSHINKNNFTKAFVKLFLFLKSYKTQTRNYISFPKNALFSFFSLNLHSETHNSKLITQKNDLQRSKTTIFRFFQKQTASYCAFCAPCTQKRPNFDVCKLWNGTV